MGVLLLTLFLLGPLFALVSLAKYGWPQLRLVDLSLRIQVFILK